jgi:hypothetical protein
MSQDRGSLNRVLDKLVDRVPVNQIAIVLIAAFATYALIRTLDKIVDPWNQRLLMLCVVAIWVLALFMVFIRSGRSDSATPDKAVRQVEMRAHEQIPPAPTDEEYREEIKKARRETTRRVKDEP